MAQLWNRRIHFFLRNQTGDLTKSPRQQKVDKNWCSFENKFVPILKFVCVWGPKMATCPSYDATEHKKGTVALLEFCVACCWCCGVSVLANCSVLLSGLFSHKGIGNIFWVPHVFGQKSHLSHHQFWNYLRSCAKHFDYLSFNRIVCVLALRIHFR